MFALSPRSVATVLAAELAAFGIAAGPKAPLKVAAGTLFAMGTVQTWRWLILVSCSCLCWEHVLWCARARCLSRRHALWSAEAVHSCVGVAAPVRCWYCRQTMLQQRCVC